MNKNQIPVTASDSKTLPILFPFTSNLSKNKMKGTANGRIYLTNKYRMARDALATLIKFTYQRTEWKFEERRMWIYCVVEMPNHNGDCANYVDGIFDAIEIGLGINDKWYAIYYWDWAVKTNGNFIIKISQS